MKTWGPSFIGRFMFAFSPAGEQPGGELVRNAEYVSGALSQLKAHHSHRMTAPVFPEPGGFLSMGRTHNGDFIGWMTTGGQPENWPVAVWGDEDDSPQVFEGMAFGEFILGVVSGTLRPEAFPDDVWKPVPVTVEPIPPQNRSDIPADHKEFIAEWGPGDVGDFISLFVPVGVFPVVRMPQATLSPTESYETLKSHHPDTLSRPDRWSGRAGDMARRRLGR